MSRIIRCMTSDKSVMATAIDSGDIVHIMQEIHKTGPVATAALGRLLTAASMMGAMLKQDNASVTLKVNGGGPLGALVAIADSKGNCRGNIAAPQVTLPLKDNGKLDVGTAVGKDGLLLVIRDYGKGEPYMGQIALVSGEIAEDITNYFAVSEQIPTVCALGVLLDKEDHKVLLAGGLLIQALPDAADAALEALEKNVLDLPSVTTMLAQGLSIEEICRRALAGFSVEILDTYEVHYACPCTKERVERALTSLPAEELLQIAREEGKMEARCQYCGRTYQIGREELEKLAASAQKQKTEAAGPAAENK